VAIVACQDIMCVKRTQPRNPLEPRASSTSLTLASAEPLSIYRDVQDVDELD
jgi:hypothetical protein